MSGRFCGVCDGPIRGADLMCEGCLSHTRPQTRAQLNRTWKRWASTGSLGAMDEYGAACAAAIREAESWRRTHLGTPPLDLSG